MSIRITTLVGWFIPLLILSSYFDFREDVHFNPILCVVFSILTIGACIPECIRILKVKRKKESKFVTTIVSIMVGVAVITLLELKERGVFIWNELYLTIPLLLFSLLFYIVCFITEDKHDVRVYFALDGIHYAHA